MECINPAKEIRKELLLEQFPSGQGYDESDVRCYHCTKWGYNCGKSMNDVGESVCTIRKGKYRKTASYQFCRHFDYVGNGE